MRSLLSLFTMWSDTRKVALMAMTAAVYVAVLLPFKLLPVIPGFTEFRPAAAVPMAFGALLGAPACWGAAFGNLVADLLGGMFGLGSVFGFAANLLLAWVSWRVAAWLRLGEVLRDKPKLFPRFAPCALLGSAACSLTLGWGVDLMGAVPYAFLANFVFLNNVIMGLVLGPIIVGILGPRVQRWELEHEEIPPSGPTAALGMALVTLGAVGGYLALNVIATGGLNLLPADTSAVHLPGIREGGVAALIALLAGLLLL